MFDRFLAKAGEMLASGKSFAIAEVVHCSKPISGKAGDKAIVAADGTVWGWIGGGCAQPAVVKEALNSLKDGRPRLVRISPSLSQQEEGVVAYNMSCHSGGSLEIYIEPVMPKPHVVILGRSPVGRTLARLAKAIHYTVSVAAPKADRETYPDADHLYTGLSLTGIRIGPQTFVVVSTQGEGDEEALEQALDTGAPYIAFVASKTKAAKVMQSLVERGLDRTKLNQVHAPAGLDIHARSQDEIAVSILAEIIQLCRTNSAEQQEMPAHEEQPSEAKDPICGMTVAIAAARYKSEHEGHTYYFCCPGCKQTFEKEPDRYAMAGLST